MVGTVIVGTIGNDHWQAVGSVPCLGKVIRGCFGGRIRRARVIGRGLREQSILAQRSVDFVSGYMDETKVLGWLSGQVAAGGLKQNERAKHVGFDEEV